MFRHGKFRVIVPDSLFAPMASGFLILIAGMLGIAFHRAWLFASLGPTAYQLGEYPEQKSSRIYNVIAGHMIGLGMGLAALAIFNAWGAPKVLSTHHLTAVRVWASVVAMVLTSAGILVMRASHPPAGATSLLVSLGSVQTGLQVISLVIGVVIVAVLGEALRFLRLHRMHEVTAEEHAHEHTA